jgi:hypothetical protein
MHPMQMRIAPSVDTAMTDMAEGYASASASGGSWPPPAGRGGERPIRVAREP